MDAAIRSAPNNDGNSAPVKADRIVKGQITCLKLSGVIDERFDGKRLAATVQATTLILDLGGVKRVSSFGVREMSEFRRRVERDVEEVILVNCPPKVVDQLNMVADFLGEKGKVLSFFAPYHCDYCDIDSLVLMRTDVDAKAIREGNPPERTCKSCTREEYFDEEESSYFAFYSKQGPVELSPHVADFIDANVEGGGGGARRPLQIDKYVQGQYTYLKLAGNLDGAFSSTKVAEGLEGDVILDVAGISAVDVAGAAEWRNFLNLIGVNTDRVHVLGCPAILLERLTGKDDLGDQVISFSIPYSCSKCQTTSSQAIDVATHYDLLKFATPPELKCEHCKSSMFCVAPEPLLARLRSLPQPEVSGALTKFIKEAKAKTAKAAAPKRADKKRQGFGPGIWAGVAIVALVVAGGMVGLNYFQQRTIEAKITTPEGLVPAAGLQNDQPKQPDWITSNNTGQAGCFDTPEKTFCVGVSSHHPSKQAALEEAWRVSLEEFVNLLALRAESEAISTQREMYWDKRQEAVARIDRLRLADDRNKLREALKEQRVHWTNVATSLQKSGLSTIVQQSESYWEEYEIPGSEETEFLGFVQLEVSNAGLDAILRTLTEPQSFAGGKVVPVFPGVAWKTGAPVEGLFVIESGGALKKAGADANDLITAVGEEAIDPKKLDGLEKRLDSAKITKVEP